MHYQLGQIHSSGKPKSRKGFFGQPKSKKGHYWPGQKISTDEVILSGCIYAKVIFTDHCRSQNFFPSLLCLVDRLDTVIHKTQKTRTKVLPSAMVGELYFNSKSWVIRNNIKSKYNMYVVLFWIWL